MEASRFDGCICRLVVYDRFIYYHYYYYYYCIHYCNSVYFRLQVLRTKFHVILLFCKTSMFSIGVVSLRRARVQNLLVPNCVYSTSATGLAIYNCIFNLCNFCTVNVYSCSSMLVFLYICSWLLRFGMCRSEDIKIVSFLLLCFILFFNTCHTLTVPLHAICFGKLKASRWLKNLPWFLICKCCFYFFSFYVGIVS